MNRGRKPEHCRDSILEMGMELFDRNGYHGTGLKEILDACQVSKGSFYNFFGSKEDFAIEIIRHFQARAFDCWNLQADQPPGCHAARLRHKIETEIQTSQAHCFRMGSLLANLSGEIGAASDAFRNAILGATNRILDALEQDMLQCQQEGSVRTDLDARALAELIWNCWQGALLRVQVEESTAPLSSMVQLLWERVLPPHTGPHKDASPTP
ncbi:TetR/AcrR family transcriptional regulator [Marinobacterium sedimentorum]|uniref:TetR/AcrR family transcriptional regulator n=1 Tax=Marinobacterium sedimentorum TaxID=2927804 RepID=UPI0020C6B881|nr:TetR/AcrR family transcriptional regulator [Marinobacterium sedimentorum]MCP8688182.1 TetR/AcrR family transcriptional regulator [Marinobacterium sedimentorum]